MASKQNTQPVEPVTEVKTEEVKTEEVKTEEVKTPKVKTEEVKPEVTPEEASVSHERELEKDYELVRSHKDALGNWVWKKVKKE